MAKKKLLTVSEAAGRLGVDSKTIRTWVRSRRLKGTVKKVRIVRDEIFVDPDSLDAAFTVTCLYCGEEFESPHPEKARFCNRRHRILYNREQLQVRPEPRPRDVS